MGVCDKTRGGRRCRWTSWRARVKATLPWLGHVAYGALMSAFLMTDIPLRTILVGGYRGWWPSTRCTSGRCESC